MFIANVFFVFVRAKLAFWPRDHTKMLLVQNIDSLFRTRGQDSDEIAGSSQCFFATAGGINFCWSESSQKIKKHHHLSPQTTPEAVKNKRNDDPGCLKIGISSLACDPRFKYFWFIIRNFHSRIFSNDFRSQFFSCGVIIIEGIVEKD